MPPLRGFSWQKTRLFRYDYVTPAGFKPELIDPAVVRDFRAQVCFPTTAVVGTIFLAILSADDRGYFELNHHRGWIG